MLAMLTSAQFGRQFSRRFGQEKTFRRERRTGTSALGILNQGSRGSGDDLALSLRTQYSNSRSTRWSDAQRSDFSVNKAFTIGPRDGSENFSSKTNLRSFGLYRDCSNSLCQNSCRQTLPESNF